MPYSPVELRHVSPKRALLGYARDEVERLLEDVANSFEQVWRERGELADKVEDLERRLEELTQREALLATTLVSAEKAAADAKASAKREAELIIAEAHQEARAIARTAQSERERLFGEARRVEALLRTALGVVGEANRPPIVASAAPTPEVAPPAAPTELPAATPDVEDHWPERRDTREFEAISDATQPPAPAPHQGVKLPPASLPADQGNEPASARDFSWGD
jgi:cell division septum initiation protein DivIVA